jgi:hypothetical protein
LRSQDLYLHSRGLSSLEISQLTDAEVAVAAGDAVEEIADGADARFGRSLGRFRAHPL